MLLEKVLSKAAVMLLVLIFLINNVNAQAKDEILKSYPETIQYFAQCLMSVEKIKSELRNKQSSDTVVVDFSFGAAGFFVDKAMMLEARAASLNFDDVRLAKHWQSIQKNSKQPEILKRMVNELETQGYSPELCIGLPDLVDQIELENSLNKSILASLSELSTASACMITSGSQTLPTHSLASIVWTGSELLVWGGKVDSVMSQQGLKYSPVTDSWSILQQSGDIPSARWAAYTGWTGLEMIVYGGSGSGSSALNTLINGSRYNPMTGVWTAINTTSSPELHYSKTVMIGNKMVVWGGVNINSVKMNTGVVYDPNLDSWTVMTIGPTYRSGYTMTTIGNQMLFYGGVDLTSNVYTYKRDLWLYTVSTNSWLQKASSPSNFSYPARAEHTAVWTENDLLVFGGRTDDFVNVARGVKYNLASNNWSVLNQNSQPSARKGHGAVWTGSEMIVWAGVNSFIMRGGGIYDPSSNEWRLMSLANSSTRRSFYSAWTGSEYLVFTNNANPSLVAGDIYDFGNDVWRNMSTQLANSAPTVQALWNLDEFSSSTGIASANGKRVLDACGDRDAKIETPAATQVTVEGVLPLTNAISFDSSSDRFRFVGGDTFSSGTPAGATFDIDFDESLTLEALIKIPNNSTQVGNIVSKDVGPGQTSWWFRVNNGVLQGLIGDGPTSSVVLGNKFINDGKWHQVAMVRDALSKKLSLYVDFELDATVDDVTTGSSITPPTTAITVAAFNDGNRQLTGDVDFVRASKGVVPISQMYYSDRVVDVVVALTNDGSSVVANSVVQYTLTVSNIGLGTANNVNIVLDTPADFSAVAWTCAASVEATCPASGSGSLNESVAIPSGGNVVYSIDATLSSTPNQSVITTANASLVFTLSSIEFEFVTANNTASSTIKSDAMFANGFE